MIGNQEMVTDDLRKISISGGMYHKFNCSGVNKMKENDNKQLPFTIFKKIQIKYNFLSKDLCVFKLLSVKISISVTLLIYSLLA